MSSESTPWVDGLTFSEVLATSARTFPDHDAVVFPRLGIRWSYREFQKRVDELARAYMALGVEPGDHVGIWSTNWPEWVLTQFATASIGAVMVNVNPAYRSHELAYILNQADIKALVICDAFKTSNYEEMVAEVAPEITHGRIDTPLRSAAFPRLEHVITIRDSASFPMIRPWPALLELAESVSEAELDDRKSAVSFDGPVNIQYTSGTTGAPKGATLSHRNLLMNAFYTGDRMAITDADRVCIPVPFYHCFGCVLGTLMCAVYGAAMVIPNESFEPEPTLEAVEKEKCTALYGVPTMFNAEVHSPRFAEFDLSSLRTGIMAGSACPIELMKRIGKDMNLTEMTIAYGQTEASPVITQSRTTDSLEARVSTVGSTIPGVEVRIVNPENGEDVADGEQGELWARGHCVMIGYYNKPEETAAAVDKDGWLHTGDLATKTKDGNYKITGRIKDMIIRGGENVYPREIEEFLLTHPEIRDVQIVGVPDEHYGEQLSAWIVKAEGADLTAEDVREYCKGKIAHYKAPHYVNFIDEYPLTVTGKVQKFVLREQAIEKLGLQEAAKIETA